EARADHRERGLVALERRAEHARDALGGDVVGGRAEPTRAHEHVVFSSEPRQRRAEGRRVVRHDGHLEHDEAELGERLREPGGVRVQELAPGELRSHTENRRGRHAPRELARQGKHRRGGVPDAQVYLADEGLELPAAGYTQRNPTWLAAGSGLSTAAATSSAASRERYEPPRAR